ncbi:MAG: cupin domain-containing protein [Saprospiraceae bacterium]
MIDTINIEEKFNLIDEYWTPKVIGELNGQYVKLAKVKGEFVWHDHENEDELFMVVKGTLFMDFRDGRTTTTKTGEIIIVPKGVEHRPHTGDKEVWIMLFEPKAIQHTGDVKSELTVEEDVWI